jgi:hypothetical protein
MAEQKIEQNDATGVGKNLGAETQKTVNDLRDFNQFAKNVYTIDDINFASRQLKAIKGASIHGDGNPNLSLRTTVPMMKLYEFQPDLIFKWLQKLTVIKNQVEGSVNTGWTVLKNAREQGGRILRGESVPTEKTTSLLNELFIEDNYPDQVKKIPIELYRDFFTGKYVRSFELPLTDPFYQDIGSPDEWSGIADVRTPSEQLNKILTFIKANAPVENPLVPEWKNSNSDKITLTSEFHLYNNNLENLAKNFKFLQALLSGAFWLQISYRQSSPNIYTVHVPGTVHIMYAAIYIQVEQIGNRRQLYSNEELKSLTTGLDIKLDSDAMFPDAYKVVVSLRSLVPNSFNTYINFILDGVNEKVEIGSTVSGGKFQAQNAAKGE